MQLCLLLSLLVLIWRIALKTRLGSAATAAVEQQYGDGQHEIRQPVG